MKHIIEYVGANYKNDSDIPSSIKKETKYTFPQLARPAVVDMADPTEEELDAIKLWYEKCKALLKHEATLDDNIQQAYSLILG